MKSRIFFVDIDVTQHYTVQVQSTSEERAGIVAKKLALSGEVDYENQDVDITDIFEAPMDDMDNE